MQSPQISRCSPNCQLPRLNAPFLAQFLGPVDLRFGVLAVAAAAYLSEQPLVIRIVETDGLKQFGVGGGFLPGWSTVAPCRSPCRAQFVVCRNVGQRQMFGVIVGQHIGAQRFPLRRPPASVKPCPAMM